MDAFQLQGGISIALPLNQTNVINLFLATREDNLTCHWDTLVMQYTAYITHTCEYISKADLL